MNNVFSLQRFVWLFNKHTKEHYKTYLMSLAVLAGVLALILAYVAFLGGLDVKMQSVIFAILLVGTGFVFTSSIYSDFGNKQRAISALTLPVSTLERFAVAWVYSFIIFQVIYIALFFVILNVAVGLNFIIRDNYKVNELWGAVSIYPTALIYFCFFHAVAFVGAAIFKKSHVIKISFAFIVFFVVLLLLNKMIIAAFFGPHGEGTGIPFTSITINEAGHQYYIAVSEWFGAFFTTIALVSAISMWTAAYFKLKEKQV